MVEPRQDMADRNGGCHYQDKIMVKQQGGAMKACGQSQDEKKSSIKTRSKPDQVTTRARIRTGKGLNQGLGRAKMGPRQYRTGHGMVCQAESRYSGERVELAVP